MMAWFTGWVKRVPLFAYFVLVFGLEWLFVVFALGSPGPPMIAVLVGSWLPNAIGLLVTGVAGGRAGLRALFGKVVLWRIGLRWYATALLAPVAMAFLAIGLHALSGNAVPGFAPPSQLLPTLLIALFTGAMGEELGWRGTALGITVLVSWTFNRTDGSLIPVFLYHFSYNFIGNAARIFGNSALFRLLAGICGAVAVAVVLFDWARFTRPAAAPTQDARLAQASGQAQELPMPTGGDIVAT